MIDVVNLKEVPESIMELIWRVEILSRKDMTSCVFPKSLNDIEIRRIRRQKYEVDSEFCRLFLYSLAMLITGIVKDYRNRIVSRFHTHLFKKCLCLLCIHINHGMGLYDVMRRRIHTSKEVEAVSSRTGLEIKRFLAPYMASEGFQREMYGIHEIELALTFFCFIYNRLQFSNPLILLLRTRPAGYRLRLDEPEAATMHYLPCPGQAERDAADVADYLCGLCGTPGYLGFQPLGNFIHVYLHPAGTPRNRSDFKNGIDPFVVIRMNQAVNEVTATSCDCSYPLAAQSGFRHFGHKSTTTFANYAGGICFVFLFETGIRLLTIFDGEQCCIDNVKNKVVTCQWRSPSFIGYGSLSHFAQILSVSPITNIPLFIYNTFFKPLNIASVMTRA